MSDVNGAARRRSSRFRAAAGGALIIALAASACMTSAPPQTTPPASKVLSLPGFRVSPPNGRGWKGDADRASRTATFSKKYSGLVRAVFDEQRIAEIFVTPLILPPAQWSAAREDLMASLKSEDGRPSARWSSRPLPDRMVEYSTSEDFVDLTKEDLGLETFIDEPGFKEKTLIGICFPADLETTHRYFEINIRITEVDTFPRLHADQRLSLLDAVVANLEIVGPFEDTPEPTGALARAVLAGDLEAVRTAVDRGADVNAKLPDWTFFEMAALCDCRDLAGILERNGGIAAVFGGETALRPFELALIADMPEIAALFLDRGITLEPAPADGPPPLALAAGLGYAEIAAKLIERGASVDSRAVGGRTPLMLACESGSIECVEALMEAGAGLDLQSEDGGTALLTSVDWGRTGIMRLLLSNGADVNLQDNEGWSCLLVAVFQGDAGLVDELIAAGADLDANVYATGRTALVQALEDGKFDIARKLIDAGADVNRHKDGQVTPLISAAAQGRADLVRILIDKGAEVNVRTDDGLTALSMAGATGRAAVVEILLKAGARKIPTPRGAVRGPS